MNNNNFINKTIKTFLTSLVISIFVFGSFYFLLSDNTSTENIDNNNKKETKKESPKLVMEEETVDNSPLANTAVDVKKEVLGVTSGTNSQDRIAVNPTGGMLAQFDDNDLSNTYSTPTTASSALTTTNATTVVVTQPSVVITNTRTATGVPTTGNEGLYILMGAFSLISGFLITNGKSLAMRSFEK